VNTARLSRILSRRMLMLLLAHAWIFLAAYFLAILLRFDLAVPDEEWTPWIRTLPMLLAVKLLVFYGFGAFHGWWRFLTFSDLADLLKAATLSTLCIITIDYFLFSAADVPRGVLILDYVTTILVLGGSRAGFRLLTEHVWPAGSSHDVRLALVVGANRAGEALVRQTNRNGHSRYRVVGFLDEDPIYHGTRLGGISVLGDPAHVDVIASRVGADVVFLVAGNMSGAGVRELVAQCQACDLPVKVVPPVEDIISGRYQFRPRDVDINDLLRREPVALDTEAIGGVLHGRRVMITGAGGSIGSEICRQVLKFRPASLILVERFETALFSIHRELQGADAECYPCIADILDRDRMRAVFERHRPEIVFHAAAHKHVPMMESNPSEAIQNNVLGTKQVADLSMRFGVDRFVLISTDKAVNPTSVMGASKQLAERYVHALASTSGTKYMVVRFGNVLGSNGSVVPIFQEQIRRGGPITITHRDMCRYFMTIPEASELVLQAAAIGNGGEIFVLDMGQPVKILDLALDMIRLSGLTPEDIEIKFTGVRPGEKLYEELRFDEEELLPTSHAKVQVAYHRPYEEDAPSRFVPELRAVLHSNSLLVAKIRELVPEYQQTVEGPEPAEAASTLEDAVPTTGA